MNNNNFKALNDYIAYFEKGNIKKEELLQVTSHIYSDIATFFEKEAKIIGEQKFLKLTSIVICNAAYFLNLHGQYDRVFRGYDRELINGELEKFPPPYTLYPNLIVNKIIAAYYLDKELGFSYITNIFKCLSPINFKNRFLMNEKSPFSFRTDFISFFHIILEFNEQCPDEELKSQLVDCLVEIILSCSIEINGELHPMYKEFYQLFDVLLEHLDKSDFRLYFVKTFKTMVNRNHNFEEEFKERRFGHFIRTLTQELYYEDKDSIDHYIKLYIDVLLDNFLEDFFRLYGYSLTTWKKSLLSEHFLSAPNKEKNFMVFMYYLAIEKRSQSLAGDGNYTLALKLVFKTYNNLVKMIFENKSTNEEFRKNNVQLHAYVALILLKIKASRTMNRKTKKSHLKEAYNFFSNIKCNDELTPFLVDICEFTLEYKEISNEVFNCLSPIAQSILEDLVDTLQQIKEPLKQIVTGPAYIKQLEKKMLQFNNSNDRKSLNKEVADIYFNELSRLQRGILIKVFKTLQLKDRSTIKELLESNLFNLKEEFLLSNLKKLHSYGLLTLEEDVVIEITPKIAEIISKYLERKVETKVITATEGNIYKPIFYHPSEMRLYRVLCEIYPQTMVFPNTSLQTVIDYDKLKELVDADTFSYYLKAHVDFIIIDTVTYLPLIAFEKDSNYNDSPESQERAKMKDEIFSKSGIPLVRLRFTKANDFDQLKREILSETKGLLLEHTGKEDSFSKTFVESIDHSKFYVE